MDRNSAVALGEGECGEPGGLGLASVCEDMDDADARRNECPLDGVSFCNMLRTRLRSPCGWCADLPDVESSESPEGNETIAPSGSLVWCTALLRRTNEFTRCRMPGRFLLPAVCPDGASDGEGDASPGGDSTKCSNVLLELRCESASPCCAKGWRKVDEDWPTWFA